MEDTLIYFGEPIKALDDSGRIGSYGIRFSKAGKNADKDLSGEYFTDKTYLGPRDGDGQECIFHHGIPVKSGLGEFADHTFAPAKARRDKVGIFVEACLDLSDEYEKAVFDLARKGKLGWSSGSASHRVVKNTDGEIVRWPVAEWSMTPQPCEPKNYGSLLPMKSFGALKFVALDDGVVAPVEPKPASLAVSLTRYLDDLTEDGGDRDGLIKSLAREAMVEVGDVEKVLSGATRRPANAKLKAFARVLKIDYEVLKGIADNQRGELKSIKAMFEEELASQTPSTWELRNALCSVVKKIAEAASAAREVGMAFDSSGKVREAYAEYARRDEPAIASQVNAYASGEWGEDEFYLKSLGDVSELTMESIAVDDHCSLAESAFKGVVARMRKYNTIRVKAGRVLSDKNRTRLAGMLTTIKQAVSDCEMLLEETKPMASDESMRAARTKHLRLQFERNRGANQHVS